MPTITPWVAVTTGAAAVFATSCCVRSRPATASRWICFGPIGADPALQRDLSGHSVDRRRDGLAAVHAGDGQLGSRVRGQRGALKSEQPAQERGERSERRVRYRHARRGEVERRRRRRWRRWRRPRLAARAADDGQLLLVAPAEAAEEHREAGLEDRDLRAVRAGADPGADERLPQVAHVLDRGGPRRPRSTSSRRCRPRSGRAGAGCRSWRRHARATCRPPRPRSPAARATG